MQTDQHGLELNGAPAAIGHYDRAVHELLHFREQVIEEARHAVEEDSAFPMGNALRAYLRLLAMEAEDTEAARGWFPAWRDSVPPERLLPRERAHLQAISVWLDGDLRGAGRMLADLTEAYPRDALALAIGHQIDFLTGNASMLQDRIGVALPAWSEDDLHYGPLLGMYAFGLEELGQYERSEDTGLRAVELDRKDVWGIHAVVHTYEMQARFGEGVRYFDARRDDWAAGNFFNFHNWWHYGLYRLEVGDVDRALEIYDTVLHNEDSEDGAYVMVDAAALLWRLYLEGIEQLERWEALADAWMPKMDPPFYSFNDMHAVMSFVGCGRLAAAEQLIADRERYVAEAHPGVTNHAMTARVGLPVCKAILAFGRGRYGQAFDLLYPIRSYVNEFGGSHAQRDAVQRTLLEAGLRAGRHELAQSLLDERIHVKPHSPYNWLKQSRLAQELGDQAAAAAAERRAQELVVASGAKS